MDKKITRKVLNNLILIVAIINIMILVIVLKLRSIKERIKAMENIEKISKNKVIVTNFDIDLCSLLSL